LLADNVFDAIKDADVECIGGLETGAIPIVAALCAEAGTRKSRSRAFLCAGTRGTATTNGLRSAPTGLELSFSSKTSRPTAVGEQAVKQARKLDCTVGKSSPWSTSRKEPKRTPAAVSGASPGSPGVTSVEQIGHRPRGGASSAPVSVSAQKRRRLKLWTSAGAGNLRTGV